MIEFESVTKVYPGGTVAVDELSLAVPAGRITVVVGPAGAGKSTLLRMVNRLVDPSAGRVLLDGAPNTGARRSQLRRGIGHVMPSAGLFPHRTVVENIETVPVLTGVRRREARTIAHALLERVGLPDTFADKYPGQLAAGQQMRVALARALAADPPILLMDEPFSALDPVIRGDLQDDLLDLQAAAPKTILFATHDIDEAIKLGDQIAVLDPGGRLAQLATPETLLVNPGSEFIADFLGRDRGIRKLAFLPAGDLPLAPACTLQAGATGARAHAIAQQNGTTWLLVLDPDRHPRGWVDSTSLLPDEVVTGAAVHPLGGTFYPDESVLAAMDAAILSPPGLAVCISDEGYALGVVSHADIADYLAGRQPTGPRTQPAARADEPARAPGALLDPAPERFGGRANGRPDEAEPRGPSADDAVPLEKPAAAPVRTAPAPTRPAAPPETAAPPAWEDASPQVKATSRPTTPTVAAQQDPVIARPAAAPADRPDREWQGAASVGRSAPTEGESSRSTTADRPDRPDREWQGAASVGRSGTSTPDPDGPGTSGPGPDRSAGDTPADTTHVDIKRTESTDTIRVGAAGSASDADTDLDSGRWEWRGDLGQWVRVAEEAEEKPGDGVDGWGPRA